MIKNLARSLHDSRLYGLARKTLLITVIIIVLVNFEII